MADSNTDANKDANAPITNPSQNLKNDNESPMTDVTLVGCDGGRVMATKAILAGHSPFFHQMFYGNFQEADKSCESVSFDWPSDVLSTIVKYCNAGEWPSESFFCKKQNSWLLDGSGSDHNEKLLAMLRLREAANYFGVTKLHGDLTSILKLQRDPSKDFFEKQFPGDSPIAFLKINVFLLEELKNLGETTGDLWDACQDNRWELARRILYAKQGLVFLQEMHKWRCNDEYRWCSDHVEENILPIADFQRQRNELVLYGEIKTERSDIRKLGDKFFEGHPDTPHEWPFVFAEAISDTQKVISILCSIADDTAELRRSFLYEVVSRFDRVISRFDREDQNPPAFQLVFDLRTHKKALEPCSAEEEAIFKNLANAINLNTHMHHEYDIPVYYLIKPCPLFPKERWEEQEDFLPGFPNPVLDDEAWRNHRCAW